ncbi:hypothetical protein [Methylorubrum sp. SB2]|uniref:hypothetical protein n=1 Tax=Methylorubrum subtropicum TaxID=3138812 RepID=UPI00313CFB9D
MRTSSRITTPALAAALVLGLAGGAWAQGTAPGATTRSTGEPGALQGKDGGAMQRSGQVPAGNPTQDTTGAIGHPKSNNSNGATTAPAAR